jgi:tetratricopeptide (TPR) repeat protein
MSVALLSPLVLAGGPWISLVGILCDGAWHDTRATGFLVGRGVVATALHAVTGSEPEDIPRSVTVVTADERRFPVAEVLAIDTAHDVCLLRIEYDNETWLRPAERVEVGEPLRVLGNPLHRRHAPLETRLTAIRLDELDHERYRVEHAMRHRSGAPVLDAAGRYVGLVSTTHEVIPADAIRTLLRREHPQTLREAHRAVAASPQGLLDFAQNAYLRGDRDRALMFLQTAVGQEPGLAAAHNMLGVLQRRAGNYPEALRQYELAITSLPSFGAAYHNLGLLRSDMEVHERAVIAARGELSVEPPPRAARAASARAGARGPDPRPLRLAATTRVFRARLPEAVEPAAQWALWPPPEATATLLVLVAAILLAGSMLRRRAGR